MPRLHTFLTLAFCLSTLSLAQNSVVVKPGDTLWGLAQRHDTTIDAILQTNGLTGTDLLPGAILVLPVDSNSAPETYTVQTGDTLYDIGVAFGVSVDDILAFNDINGANIYPGQQLRIKAPLAPPPALVVRVEPGDSLWRIAEANGTTVEAIMSANGLTSSVVQPGKELTIPGRYAGTTADQGGTTPPTIRVSPGDTLWHIAKRYNTTVPTLIAANELTSERIGVGQVLRIVPSSDLVRAAPATETASPGAMLWPIQGLITSRFGYRQLRISGSNFHTGLDIDGETGDPIVAAVSGVVSFSGWRSGYGNLVIVQSGNTEYYYAHASELLVVEGQVVSAGDLLALIGSTGRSTGSHLHFEIRVDGKPIDPLSVLEQYAGH